MKNKRVFFLITGFFILLLDQLTKFYIRTNFLIGDSKSIIGNFFTFRYTTNTGVSFGLFKGANWLFIIISFFALGLFFYAYFKKKKYPLPFALISAGILGNLIDRIFLGYVVDFISISRFPIFNIADSVISIGIIWLLILLTKNNEDLF